MDEKIDGDEDGDGIGESEVKVKMRCPFLANDICTIDTRFPLINGTCLTLTVESSGKSEKD